MRLSQIVNIPIQNIYYLLYYPCGKLAEKDVVAMEAIDWTPLLEMTVATTSGVVRRPPQRRMRLAQAAYSGRL